MILRRYVGTASVVCGLAFGLAGSASADVAINQTGADSQQKVVMNNTSDVTTLNVNTVQVTNANVQDATSGNVSADKNTTVGGVGSGNASNDNSTVTTVGVNNPSVADVIGGGSGNGSGTVAGGAGSSAPAAGSVLGASTVGGFGGGAAMLPEVGASVPVDVSALRAAWHPQTAAPTAVLAKTSRMFTGLMLLTATLLSVLGALGSAWYTRKREERA